jgi:hypothetical protein
MSNNRGIPNGWLSFIPYAHYYQLGRVAGSIELGGKKVENTGVWVLLTHILYDIVLSIGMLIAMVPYFVHIISIGFSDNTMPGDIMPAMYTLLFSLLIFMVVVVAAQAFLYLILYLALHKIFSLYSGGQKPVFYLILAIFIPLAQAILLFRHRNRPLLETGNLPDEPEAYTGGAAY